MQPNHGPYRWHYFLILFYCWFFFSAYSNRNKNQLNNCVYIIHFSTYVLNLPFRYVRLQSSLRDWERYWQCGALFSLFEFCVCSLGGENCMQKGESGKETETERIIFVSFTLCQFDEVPFICYSWNNNKDINGKTIPSPMANRLYSIHK